MTTTPKPPATKPQADTRARQIKAIHAMKRELALTDDSYRDLCVAVTGVDSSRDMTDAQRDAVIDRMRGLGAGKKRGGFKAPFKGQGKAGGKAGGKAKTGAPRPFRAANSQQQLMIRGLWAELAGMGAIKDRSEDALAAYILRQAKVDALQFVGSSEATKVIGGLKGWLRREKTLRGMG